MKIVKNLQQYILFEKPAMIQGRGQKFQVLFLHDQTWGKNEDAFIACAATSRRRASSQANFMDWNNCFRSEQTKHKWQVRLWPQQTQLARPMREKALEIGMLTNDMLEPVFLTSQPFSFTKAKSLTD